MYQTLVQRYDNGCLMLMDHRDDGYHFLGTAFVVHARGYMLTAAHIVESAKNPVVVKPGPPGEFTQVSMVDTLSYPVTITQLNSERDLALLKMEIDSELGAPDDFVGNPEKLEEGTSLLTFGISLGHFQVHKVMTMQAILSAKLISSNGTDILLFDCRVHPGDVGAPLVNVETGRIVGIIQGVFNPVEMQQLQAMPDYEMVPSLSYAVSITHAKPMLEGEGLAGSGWYTP